MLNLQSLECFLLNQNEEQELVLQEMRFRHQFSIKENLASRIFFIKHQKKKI